MIFGRAMLLACFALLIGCERAGAVDNSGAALPKPLADVAPGAPGELQTAVFAGGCFWGVQAVFQHVKGVHSSAISGICRRDDRRPSVRGGGLRRHRPRRIGARCTFDPAQVSYGSC